MLQPWKLRIHQVEQQDASRRLKDRRCYNAALRAVVAGGGGVRGRVRRTLGSLLAREDTARRQEREHARDAQRSEREHRRLSRVHVRDPDAAMQQAKRASIQDEKKRLEVEMEQARVQQAMRRSQLDAIRREVRGILEPSPSPAPRGRVRPRSPSPAPRGRVRPRSPSGTPGRVRPRSLPGTPRGQAAHLFLRVGARKDHVLLLRHRHGKDGKKWGTPGGEVDPGETFWKAMKREFREETGVKLPRLTNIQHVDTYRGKVRIYVADLSVPLQTVLPPTLNTPEITGWTTASIGQLEHRSDLRGGVRSGIRAARRAGLL